MSFGSCKEKIPVQPKDDPPIEEESSFSISSLSPSLSSKSTGDIDVREDFTNEEVYVLDATNSPKEMVIPTTPLYAF